MVARVSSSRRGAVAFWRRGSEARLDSRSWMRRRSFSEMSGVFGFMACACGLFVQARKPRGGAAHAWRLAAKAAWKRASACDEDAPWACPQIVWDARCPWIRRVAALSLSANTPSARGTGQVRCFQVVHDSLMEFEVKFVSHGGQESQPIPGADEVKCRGVCPVVESLRHVIRGQEAPPREEAQP